VNNLLQNLKREITRSHIIAAWEAYDRREPLSLDALCIAVHAFAYKKLHGLEIDKGFRELGSAETADDWAQDVSLKAWKRLDTFRGDTGAEFHAWVHMIINNRKNDAANYLIKQKKMKIALTLNEGEDAYTGTAANGDSDEYDNPALYPELNERGFRDIVRLRLSYNSMTPEEHRLCEAFSPTQVGPKRWADVRDTEEFSRSAQSNAEAAEMLGWTVSKVKVTIHRLMKKKLEQLENDRIEADAYKKEWHAWDQIKRDRQGAKTPASTIAAPLGMRTALVRTKGWYKRKLAEQQAELDCRFTEHGPAMSLVRDGKHLNPPAVITERYHALPILTWLVYPKLKPLPRLHVPQPHTLSEPLPLVELSGVAAD